jgi:hypothetical protein
MGCEACLDHQVTKKTNHQLQHKYMQHNGSQHQSDFCFGYPGYLFSLRASGIPPLPFGSGDLVIFEIHFLFPEMTMHIVPQTADGYPFSYSNHWPPIKNHLLLHFLGNFSGACSKKDEGKFHSWLHREGKYWLKRKIIYTYWGRDSLVSNNNQEKKEVSRYVSICTICLLPTRIDLWFWATTNLSFSKWGKCLL